MDHAGLQRVSGGSDLKKSQYYPRLFGQAVGQLYAQHEREVRKSVKQHGHLAYLCVWLPMSVHFPTFRAGFATLVSPNSWMVLAPFDVKLSWG